MTQQASLTPTVEQALSIVLMPAIEFLESWRLHLKKLASRFEPVVVLLKRKSRFRSLRA